MRMFLPFVLLFIPMTSLANVDPEICFNIGNDGNLCNSTAGCFYDAEFNGENKCRLCPQDTYCLATETQPRECPSPFTDSDLGATSINECYKSEDCDLNGVVWSQGCRRYYNNTVVCNSASAHMEGDACYINARNCQQFASEGCSGDIRSLDILWTGTGWNVSYCECTEQFSNTPSLNCSGQQIKKTTSTLLSGVDQQIDYTNGEIKQYECFSCIPGYYAPRVYSRSDSDRPATCIPFSGQYSVCNCEATPQGTYSENCTWSVVSNGTNPCPKHDCPNPGQTTNGDGAGINQDACHYTHDTQFCDAKGCFSFNDTQLDEWGLNN